MKPSLLLALVLACPACVFIDADSQTRYSGQYVGDETLRQVEPGATEEFVLALLGEPSSRIDMSDGGAIWKWRFTRHQQSSNSILLLIDDHSSKEVSGTVYVLFGADHLVQRTWRDGE